MPIISHFIKYHITGNVPYYITSYYIIPQHVHIITYQMIYYVVLSYITLYHTVSQNTMSHHIVLHRITLHHHITPPYYTTIVHLISFDLIILRCTISNQIKSCHMSSHVISCDTKSFYVTSHHTKQYLSCLNRLQSIKSQLVASHYIIPYFALLHASYTFVLAISEW